MVIYICEECKTAKKKCSFRIPLTQKFPDGFIDCCPNCGSKNIKKYD